MSVTKTAISGMSTVTKKLPSWAKPGYLKRLHEQRGALAADLVQARQSLTSLTKTVQSLTDKLLAVDRQIAHLTVGPPVVSEHAMVRYVERVLGYDLDVLRTAIVPADVEALIQTVGNGEYPVVSCGQTFRIVVRQNVVITIKTPDEEVTHG